MSIATLLSQHHQVTAVDIVPEKVEMINNRKSPIQDDYIEKYLAEKELNLTATLDAKAAYSDADFVVIAAPTNYDSHTQHFDTSAVEAVIKLVMEYNPDAIMVIKSTIPVGYMLAKKKPMSELAAPLKIYPQVLENVRVTDKKAAQNDEAVQAAVKNVAEALGDTGRILVRESGTEPVVRVMVEAPDHDTCQKYVSEVVDVICEKGYKA